MKKLSIIVIYIVITLLIVGCQKQSITTTPIKTTLDEEDDISVSNTNETVNNNDMNSEKELKQTNSLEDLYDTIERLPILETVNKSSEMIEIAPNVISIFDRGKDNYDLSQSVLDLNTDGLWSQQGINFNLLDENSVVDRILYASPRRLYLIFDEGSSLSIPTGRSYLYMANAIGSWPRQAWNLSKVPLVYVPENIGKIIDIGLTIEDETQYLLSTVEGKDKIQTYMMPLNMISGRINTDIDEDKIEAETSDNIDDALKAMIETDLSYLDVEEVTYEFKPTDYKTIEALDGYKDFTLFEAKDMYYILAGLEKDEANIYHVYRSPSLTTTFVKSQETLHLKNNTDKVFIGENINVYKAFNNRISLTYDYSEDEGSHKLGALELTINDQAWPVIVEGDYEFSKREIDRLPKEILGFNDKSNFILDFDRTINILLLGDSITKGVPYTYRYELSQLLELTDTDYDFVGTQADGIYYNDTVWDTDHEGHGGLNTQRINKHLDEWIQYYDVDIALIHLGTNDILYFVANYSTPEEAIHEMESIINKLRAKNPQVTILLAHILPYGNKFSSNINKYNVFVSQWNQLLTTLSFKMSQEKSIIRIVDMNTSFGNDDLYDGIHPNKAGATKMAQAWAEVLFYK